MSTEHAAAGAEHGVEADVAAIERLHDIHRRLRQELARVIIGQEAVIDRLLICLFARGHALLMGVPGLAKTMLIHALSDLLALKFSRIQFTPDLMPSDITGTDILQERRAVRPPRLRVRPRPDLRQHRPGRRNQPHPAQNPGRAAAGDAGIQASTPVRTPFPSTCRSSCWPRRTRSSRRAPTRCPRRSSTASCS
jgi:hypothetical protein